MTDNTNLHLIFDGCKIVGSIAQSLHYLAESFADTGNRNMADRLSYMAISLEEAEKDIRGGYSAHINHSLIDAEMATANMMQAMLSVSKMTLKNNPK